MASRGFLDLDVPFFIPVGRRVATVAVASLWGLYELSSGSMLWGVILLAMAAIAAWKFNATDWEAVAKRDEET